MKWFDKLMKATVSEDEMRWNAAVAKAIAKERVRQDRLSLHVDKALAERIARRGHFLRPARKRIA